MAAEIVRKPAVAGSFYPRDPARVRAMVQSYIEGSRVEPAPERVVALVVPHAGYEYSGPTAGFAYARVRGKRPKRVILLGCSHREYIPSASIYERGAFLTPLGSFPIDEVFAEALAKKAESRSASPHLMEHSLEVQLPFLAALFGLAPIVPVLFGAPSSEWHARLGETLATMVDEDDLLLASTDLSHYLNEEAANAIDKQTIEGVLSQDWQRFAEGIETGAHSMCGATAVTVAMTYSLARGADAWNLLDYRTSAKSTGDTDRVVGYGAISMERSL